MRVEPVTLENIFVRLEPLEERHREPLRAAGEDPELWRFAVINQHGANFDAWMDDRLNATRQGPDLTFAVIDKATSAAVGSSSYLGVVLAHRRLEIGWTWYQRRCWAGAVNPSCKRLLMGHGFEALGLNRIELKLDATNTRSWNAVERLGAKYEGTFRHHMAMPDGRLRDSAYFSVLRSEWPAVKAGLDARLAAFKPSLC
ncbi:MAG TPA: GNAT family N-acetyltransferase [Parvularcula sp.]|nr:GNAT family N-acetyltransferase [Parvularcula sp.]HBS30282.1 GNAT family N-acetyltransferase [Parvularcula sp.]HBS36714.1 GNAT family N-acetyltransferase [Parvularcula sp.]